MADRGIAGLLADRLNWQHPDSGFDAETDSSWVARILATMFGFGGFLLLATLLVDGSPDRNLGGLALLAAMALCVSAFIIVVYDRLPMWFLRASPAIGSIMFALCIYFAGPEASDAYAMFMAWIVIGAALFLDTRLILAHGALSVAAYAFALYMLEGSDDLDPLRIMIAAGTAIGIAFVMGSVAGRLREVLLKLEDAASTDPLTGLLNRRALEEAFDVELARAARGHFGLGVVMLDLDGFKRFNDAHGHQAGDSALRRLSHVLTSATRSIDHVGRVGGEEFAILAPESSAAGAVALAERLRRATEVEFSGPGGLTASCGVASYPDNGTNRDALIGAADGALYQAKALGRNRAVVASTKPRPSPDAVAS